MTRDTRKGTHKTRAPTLTHTARDAYRSDGKGGLVRVAPVATPTRKASAPSAPQGHTHVWTNADGSHFTCTRGEHAALSDALTIARSRGDRRDMYAWRDRNGRIERSWY